MSRWDFLKDGDPAVLKLEPKSTNVAALGVEDRVRTLVEEGTGITDLKTWGFRAAGAAHGSPPVLRTIIGWIYNNKLTIDDDFARTEQHRVAGLGDEIVKVETDLAKTEHLRSELEAELKSNEQQVIQKRQDLAGVRAGDSALIEPHGLADRAAFYIAAAIIGLLTIYLFLFYVSAIYNAFLFDPAKSAEEGLRTGRELSVTIFNGEAFQKAWSSGAMTFAFLSTAPSIVVGLGFLIHHFWKVNKLAVVAIVTVTFLFDLLLAYEIVYQIHRIKLLTGETQVEWTTSVLTRSPEFYIILLAGFVVYVIWGLILNVVLEGAEKFGPARVAVRRLMNEIRLLEATSRQTETKLQEAKRTEAELKANIRGLEKRQSPSELRNNVFKRHLDEVMQGWLTYISQAYPRNRHERQEEAERICHETVAMLTK
jgi:hypothetical protein